MLTARMYIERSLSIIYAIWNNYNGGNNYPASYNGNNYKKQDRKQTRQVHSLQKNGDDKREITWNMYV